MKRKTFFVLLALVCCIGAILRQYKINGPVADWHSWRQVDTAAVARNYVRFGVDPLRPQYDDLSNIQSGKDNPNGWRMVEFPFYQLLGVGTYRLIPGISIEIALRIVSIISSVISIYLLGVIGRKTVNSFVGLGVALFFAVLPYSVFYGRSILPESFMVCLVLISLSLAMFSESKQKIVTYALLIGSAVVASLALLVKPFAIFLLAPLPYLFLLRLGISWSGLVVSILSFIISVLPIVLWRKWILNYPEGIPVYLWLFNEGNIRFKGAWFFWLFAERIGKLILGYWGIALLAVGIVRKNDSKGNWFLHILLLGSLAYMVVIARGNVQHDYYQILLLPIISLYLGKGLEWFFRPPKESSRIIAPLMGGVIGLFIIAFSWYEVRGFYWVNRPEIVEAGLAADRLIPKEAKVIAPYNGDTTFLYQTNRQGWPIGFEIEKKISQGATHYITVSPTDADGETKDLAERYTVLVRNEKFAIIDLTKAK